MVLPRPTSSASSRFTRGASMARATGSSWYGSTTTPERSGACRALTSAEVTADQRTASRKAASRSGGSKPSLVTSGSEPSWQDAAARLDLPDDRQGLAVPAVLDALQGQQGTAWPPGARFFTDHPPLAADLHQGPCLPESPPERSSPVPPRHVPHPTQPIALSIICHGSRLAITIPLCI